MPPRPKRTRKKHLRVGDRVRFRVGFRDLEGVVVEDRGDIGLGGRHVVALVYVEADGERVKLDWPEEELVALPRRRRAPA